MPAKNFRELFILELADMFSSEQQIINELPNVIKAVESTELKNALTNHLNETKEQLVRLKQIFKLLNEAPPHEKCEAMKGILEEGKEFVEQFPKSSLRDAALIGACQKVEHYEIASYGTLYAHAKNLDLGSEILDLINETLDEEANADKKLTSIAEGGIFTSGINTEAEKVSVGNSNSKKRKF